MKLRDFPVVYLDTQTALQYAYQNELREGTVIRTYSPEVLLNPPAKMVVEDISTKTSVFVERWVRQQGAFQEQIYESAKSLEYDHVLATSIAASLFRKIQLIRWATSLEPSDFHEKRAVVTSSDSSAHVKSPFEILLQGNPQRHILTYEEHSTQSPPTYPGRWALARVSSRELLEFVVWKKLWTLLPKSVSRGTVLLGKDSSLLRETACHLARRGYALETLSDPKISVTEGDTGSQHLPLLEMLHSCIAEYFGDLMPDQAQMALSQHINQWMSSELTCYARFQQAWEQYFEGLPASWNIRILCHSSLKRPKWACLHSICRERGIYIASFQHGVARALDQRAEPHYWILKEEPLCDHLFTYDPKSAEHSRKNPFSIAKIDVAGTPNYYLKKSRYRVKDVPDCDIIYTKMLYEGYWRSLGISQFPDFQKAQFEHGMVDEVFANLPHTILYKTYPTELHDVEDGIREKLLEHPHIYYFEKHHDLRYLFAHGNLVVTLHPTGTLGLCFAQQIPIVFLHLPMQIPLVSTLVPLFQKAFFFFDYREPNFFQDLRTFLSQPMADIQKQWQLKRKAQEELWIQYFGCDPYTEPSRAGKRAARLLLNHLENISGRE